ncbi:MAG TPA: histidine phosphatase family protein [Polyangia bacterium]
MQIVLARHGETSWNVEGRYQGQGFDIPLSEAGLGQAGALRERLKDMTFRRAVSSPLLRARQTAELVLADASRILRFDPALMEMAHGEWEGRLDSEIRKGDEALRQAWRETPHLVTLPGGESFQRVLARAWPAFCEACQGLSAEDTLLVVSHDAVNRALLCQILGLPMAQVWRFRQAPACLNLLEGPDAEHLAVVRLNDAVHLAPLFGEVVHRRV